MMPLCSAPSAPTINPETSWTKSKGVEWRLQFSIKYAVFSADSVYTMPPKRGGAPGLPLDIPRELADHADQTADPQSRRSSLWHNRPETRRYRPHQEMCRARPAYRMGLGDRRAEYHRAKLAQRLLVSILTPILGLFPSPEGPQLMHRSFSRHDLSSGVRK